MPPDAAEFPEPKAYREFRPAWQSFAVYFFGAAVFLGGPVVNPQAVIRPALSCFLAFCCLAYILLLRFGRRYRLEGGVLTAISSFPLSRKASTHVPQIRRIDLRRGLTQRLLRVAHVYIYVEGRPEPALKLFGVARPQDFKRLLLKLGASDQTVTGAWRK
jgi:hypothetical protein